MSRHRFVRNLDLDAEMEEEEEEDGMTAEQQAQMKTSMPIARAMLKDVKPPIGDSAIADSLWHYYFDVEKATSWLRKDWERKGEAGPPPHLVPTPDQDPRRRSVKRQRMIDSEPPLTALQRLSLSRHQPSQSSSSSNRSTSKVRAIAETASEGSKPKSKLALLAEQRRAAASAKSSPAPSISSSLPSSSSAPQPVSIESPSKPLSKLAQKMAAARAAKNAATADTKSATNGALSPGDEGDVSMGANSPTEEDEVDSSLFPKGIPTETTPRDSRSTFFDLLTTTHHRSALPASTLSMHLPAAGDVDELEKRVRSAFGPDVQSPDDLVLRARQGRAVAKASAVSTPKSASLPGKPRVPNASQSSTPRTQPNSPATKSKSDKSSASVTPMLKADQASSSAIGSASHDLAGLHLDDQAEDAAESEKFKEKPALSMKQEELIAKVRKEEAESERKNISLIVVGHVDAGKSTLMGRLLYEVGELSEKEKTANERGSKKIGKGSFAFAWGLDALGDERDRGVTIDIATTHFETPHRNITLLDAPGHRDFIPAMISGAAQADVALMVVDGSPGEFEAGFDRGGQTREHAWLVRSLGVKEIVVGINKMDVVNWSQDRYDDIVEALKPFLVSAGFAASKTIFMPLAAMEGVNVMENNESTLKEWYSGPTLMEALDKVEVPARPYDAPFRIPLSNVFKGQTAVASGVAVSGRLCGGIVQVGDRVRSVPGDEVGSIRTIEVDDDSAPYAVAGQNVTLYLSGIDPIHLAIGSVLCPTSKPVPLVTRFTAQILVFDLQSPIITGTSVELFHHSVNLPATISELLSVNEKGGNVRQKPRVLQKGVTATVEISLRALSGSRVPVIPLETAAVNKEMGRVLIRRGGETIAAGVILETL